MRTFFNPVVNRIVRSAAWIHRRAAGPDPVCSLVSCLGTRPLWQRLIGRRFGIVFHGSFYCGPKCLETALVGQISRLRSMARPTQTASRMPLGLLMVARGKLTPVEVQAALEAQRRARYGTIGDWIEKLGFASEQDVTSALALQWGCPVAASFDHSGFDRAGFDHTSFDHAGFDQATRFRNHRFPLRYPVAHPGSVSDGAVQLRGLDQYAQSRLWDPHGSRRALCHGEASRVPFATLRRSRRKAFGGGSSRCGSSRGLGCGIRHQRPGRNGTHQFELHRASHSGRRSPEPRWQLYLAEAEDAWERTPERQTCCFGCKRILGGATRQ